jgi:hypothetical protein
MNPLEVLEALIDDDPFIRAYPSLSAYIRAWDEEGGPEVECVPDELLYEFYADHVPVDEALQMWFTYTPLEQIGRCQEVLRDWD